MKIYSMTATFGKLENVTLTLQPGLNIIQAPNEWGKSTWCAFLVSMLYGIDTRARSTATSLADKDRYAPWSGAPMAGRIDLNWNGRDITIERSSRGRVIFGNFRAYETDTGLDVPELNGLECGKTLLGVERSVFVRSGFLRLNDLPVTQDEALRRRLSNLVTTGDESDDGDHLEETLKNLKNKCRHNHTGLLPQAENDRDQIQQSLYDLQDLNRQAAELQAEQQRVAGQITALKNHAAALNYQASLDNQAKLAQAEEALAQTERHCAALENACKGHLPRTEAQNCLERAQLLSDEIYRLQQRERELPPLPAQPALPRPTVDAESACRDQAQYAALEVSKKKNGLFVAIYALLAVAVLAFGLWQSQWLLWCGLAAAAAGLAVLTACILRTTGIRRKQEDLAERYPGLASNDWASHARQVAEAWEKYDRDLAAAQAGRADLDRQRRDLQERIQALTGGATLSECLPKWKKAVDLWEDYDRARKDLEQCKQHHQILQSMVKPVAAPEGPDPLHYTAEETERLLERGRMLQQQLHAQLGQAQGKADSLGSEYQLRARLDALSRRIHRLEDLYYALEMAQDNLRSAKQQLQRRFAPRISQRAQELFSRLTGGRYRRITLGDDFSLTASAEGEVNLHPAQYRSDGTVDQLYLALRLAVAEELTPDAPLVLDDVFARFDDTRLAIAMDVLRETAETKQVILFTCQGREKEV